MRTAGGASQGFEAGRLDAVIVFPNNRARALGSLGERIAAITPPVHAGLLAAFLRRAGFSTDLLDAEAEGLAPAAVASAIGRLRPRLAVVCTDHVNSGDVTKMAAASDTLRALREQGARVPVLLEGIVPSAYPGRMLTAEGADYACRGEPFEPVSGLLAFLRAGGDGARLQAGQVAGIWARHGDDVVEGGRAPLWTAVGDLPAAPWDLLPPGRYRAHHWHCFDRLDRRAPYAAVFTAFGCPYHCSFCSVNVEAGGPNYRPRRSTDVVAELDALARVHGVRNIRLLDHVFGVRPAATAELCERIAALGHDLNLWAYARTEAIRSRDILRCMRRAGVRWLAYGIESASDRVRQGVGKGSDARHVGDVLEWTRAEGIHIVGNFIFGLPDDDRASMQSSLDLAVDFNFEWANFYCAMAYPGTALHDELTRAGVSLPERWSAYGQYASDCEPLATRHVSSADVVAFRDEAFQRYYAGRRYQSMIERTFGAEALDCVREILSHRLVREPPAGRGQRA